jgi:ribonuclease P protein component
MLERRFRFHGHGSLRVVYKYGDVTRNRSLMLKYNKSDKRVHSRATVIVSKKVFKAAAKRNRIRRRIYEVVRKHWDEIDHPYDLVFTVFDKMLFAMPADELEGLVVDVMNQARLLNRSSSE